MRFRWNHSHNPSPTVTYWHRHDRTLKHAFWMRPFTLSVTDRYVTLPLRADPCCIAYISFYNIYITQIFQIRKMLLTSKGIVLVDGRSARNVALKPASKPPSDHRIGNVSFNNHRESLKWKICISELSLYCCEWFISIVSNEGDYRSNLERKRKFMVDGM